MSDDVDVTKEDLTDKQLELLEMIREDPDATQKEFADELGITPAAVGSRVRQIPGMNWMSRRWFIEEFFNDEQDVRDNGGGTTSDHEAVNEDSLDEAERKIEQLEEQLSALEERVDDLDQNRDTIEDPELVRKLVLTVSNSDQFTEEEEDRLLDALIG
jgi:predicted transcriptional regulator